MGTLRRQLGSTAEDGCTTSEVLRLLRDIHEDALDYRNDRLGRESPARAFLEVILDTVVDLLPEDFRDLQAVTGLRYGRTGAHETEPGIGKRSSATAARRLACWNVTHHRANMGARWLLAAYPSWNPNEKYRFESA